MAPQRRLALFVVVAAALLMIAAALSLALRGPAGVSHQARQAPAETAPVVLRSEMARKQPPPAPARRQPRASRGAPSSEDLPVGARRGARPDSTTRHVERRARAFVAALLRREVGQSGAAARRSIRATATPQLASFVLAESPRVPLATRTPAVGRIASVEPVRRGERRALTHVTVTRNRMASVLLVELIRSGGRWRAAVLR